MNKKRLQLLPHDANWKNDFLNEKRRIEAELNDSSVFIEHVGSTSIPNVYAKPILDLAILCGEKSPESLIKTLENLGYEYRGRFDEESGHFYAVLDEGDVRLCQAHIYTEANADWFSKLKFRDVLTQNVELAREYNDYKLKLAETISDKSEYAGIKTKWIDKFILKVL